MNPITALLQLLSGCTDCEEIKSLCSLFPHGAHHGQGLHLDLADDVSGELTLSLTLLDYDGHSLSASFDSRVPICASRQKLQAARNAISAAGFSYDEHFVAPHAVPDNTPFINTLLDCYESFSGPKVNVLPLAAALMPTELKMLSHLAVPLVTLTITCTGQMSLRKSQHSS